MPSPFDLGGYVVPGKNRSILNGVSPTLASRFEELIRAAPPEIREQMRIASAFRTREHQQRLFDASDKSGKMVARPGHSQHERGNAFDLNYLSPAAKAYAHANAGKFGLRFPMSYEPWHIEPVGARTPNPGNPKDPLNDIINPQPVKITELSKVAPYATEIPPMTTPGIDTPAVTVNTPAPDTGNEYIGDLMGSLAGLGSGIRGGGAQSGEQHKPTGGADAYQAGENVAALSERALASKGPFDNLRALGIDPSQLQVEWDPRRQIGTQLGQAPQTGLSQLLARL